jgi:hypothetical protein
MTRKLMTAAASTLALLALATGVALAHPNGEDGGGGGGGGDGSGTPATPDDAGRFLPDLVQIMPGRVDIATRSSRRGTRTLLTFASAVENHGTGPLILRSSRSGASMASRQVATRSDGRRETVAADAGRLSFVRGGGHSHWHLMGFQRFELRTVGGRSLRRDQKTGFCLGDRYDATGARRSPGEPAAAIYTRRCGLGQPGRTSLTQGISVGFGDDYPPRVEGQYIDITGLGTGRYVLVHRSDPAGRIVELDKANNVASMLVKVVRGRRTRARILSWCNFTESCATPGLHRR